MRVQEPPILLIEDNPMDIDLTLRLFSKNRVVNPIEIARDGEEALAYLTRWEMGETPPVVALLDLHLPKISGEEVLRNYRESRLASDIPVILLVSSEQDPFFHPPTQLDGVYPIVKPLSYVTFTEIALKAGFQQKLTQLA